MFFYAIWAFRVGRNRLAFAWALFCLFTGIGMLVTGP